MYYTVLNHERGWNYAKQTYLICRTNTKNYPLVLENMPGIHAEMELMNRLHRMDKSVMTTITIYISNSPCSSEEHNCARRLFMFLNENPNVILILYVTNLYNIRRLSCMFESHYRWVSADNHNAYATGLKNLMEHSRCVVSAFSQAVWSELFDSVRMSEELKSKLLGRYKDKLDKNDRSREEEDNCIRSDLVCIRCNPPALQHQIKFPEIKVS